MIDQLPIFGICGPRGSGKTTLIEQMLPPLGRSGLKIAVVKHGARGVGVDRAGKDSDRLFQAGADVLLQGPRQGFFRARRADDEHWTRMILSLAGEYDLVLVEGHKGAPFRKVWLLGDRQAGPPADVTNVAAVLPRDSDRLAAALPIVARCVAEQWMKTPVFGCVLIGGNSARMGSPKHLLRRGATTWLEQTAQLLEHVCRSVIFSGAGGVPDSLAAHPRLADVPDADEEVKNRYKEHPGRHAVGAARVMARGRVRSSRPERPGPALAHLDAGPGRLGHVAEAGRPARRGAAAGPL